MFYFRIFPSYISWNLRTEYIIYAVMKFYCTVLKLHLYKIQKPKELSVQSTVFARKIFCSLYNKNDMLNIKNLFCFENNYVRLRDTNNLISIFLYAFNIDCFGTRHKKAFSLLVNMFKHYPSNSVNSNISKSENPHPDCGPVLKKKVQ